MKRKNTYARQIIGKGVTNLVGIGLIGASAGAANAIPAGTAKTFAGTAVGLQGAALVGHNLVKRSKKKRYIY